MPGRPEESQQGSSLGEESSDSALRQYGAVGSSGAVGNSLNVTISTSLLLHFDASPKTKQLQEQP